MSANFERAAEILGYEPEPLPIDREAIRNSAYDQLCEMVNNNEITTDEANEMYNLWREQYDMD
jgi:hypothetical protein